VLIGVMKVTSSMTGAQPLQLDRYGGETRSHVSDRLTTSQQWFGLKMLSVAVYLITTAPGKTLQIKSASLPALFVFKH